MALADSQDHLASRVLLEQVDLADSRGLQELQDSQDFLDTVAQQEQVASVATQVLREHRVLVASQVHLDSQVLQELLDLVDFLVHLDSQAQQGLLALVASLALLEQVALADSQDLAVLLE